jgi:hypothetical protein
LELELLVVSLCNTKTNFLWYSWKTKEMKGKEMQCKEMQGMEWHGKKRHGTQIQGKVGKCKARQG